jgi:hypothetical protein
VNEEEEKLNKKKRCLIKDDDKTINQKSSPPKELNNYFSQSTNSIFKEIFGDKLMNNIQFTLLNNCSNRSYSNKFDFMSSNEHLKRRIMEGSEPEQLSEPVDAKNIQNHFYHQFLKFNGNQLINDQLTNNVDPESPKFEEKFDHQLFDENEKILNIPKNKTRDLDHSMTLREDDVDFGIDFGKEEPEFFFLNLEEQNSIHEHQIQNNQVDNIY